MGSWVKTCGLSNLPIAAGEQVHVFVLEQLDYWDRSSSISYWEPLCLPYTARYDGFGGGENNHPNLQHILDGLRRNMVNTEPETLDIPLTPATLDETTFYAAVNCGELSIRDVQNRATPNIDFVMFRASIVQHICEHWEPQIKRSSYTDGLRTYKFADVLAGISEHIENFKSEGLISYYTRNAVPLAAVVGRFMSLSNKGLVPYYIDQSLDLYSSLLKPWSVVVQLLVEGKEDKAAALMADVLLGIHLDLFIEFSRKLWIPSSHEGRGDVGLDAAKVLNEAIRLDIAKMKDSQ